MKNLASAGYHLDAIDKEIIYLLMDNAKTSLAHISSHVGISTTAVHQRIKIRTSRCNREFYLFPESEKSRLQSDFLYGSLFGSA